MNGGLKSPWRNEEAFPEKPAGSEYGYMSGRKQVPCSKEELIRRCGSQDIPFVQLVWQPESSRIVPVSEVPFLSPVLIERNLRHFVIQRRVAVFCMVSFLVMGIPRMNDLRGITWTLILVGLVGVLPFITASRSMKTIMRLKGEMARGNAVPVTSMGGMETTEVGTHAREESRFGPWVMQRQAPVTGIVLGMIFVVSLIQLAAGLPKSIEVAGLDKAVVWRGDWWRLLTATVLHGNLMHLALNASALYAFGRLVEILASRTHFVLTFLVSAVAGSVFSLILLPDATSVGASGGVLGLVGFLTVLGVRRKDALPRDFAKGMAITVLFTVIIGLFGFALIDNAAHLGGFVAGVAIGAGTIRKGEELPRASPSIGLRAMGIAAMVVLLGSAGWAVRVCFS